MVEQPEKTQMQGMLASYDVDGVDELHLDPLATGDGPSDIGRKKQDWRFRLIWYFFFFQRL